jgi:hypothetical protein
MEGVGGSKEKGELRVDRFPGQSGKQFGRQEKLWRLLQFYLLKLLLLKQIGWL